MRAIQLSDSTYAALWARWKEGDDGEEGVIRRLLGIDAKPSPVPTAKEGFYREQTYGVEFPLGLQLFRTFKGTDRLALVQPAGFKLDDNRTYSSLNKLSAAIGAPTENAWMGWRYQDGNEERLIAEMRPKDKIRRR